MISLQRLEKMSHQLDMIADDAESDAKQLDGEPFNGKTMAENFGQVYASINALAKDIKELIDDQIEEVIS